MDPRSQRAARLRGYFDLQLRFAAALAAAADRPLADTVAWFTNLHRRFGLGVLRDPALLERPFWQHYVLGLAQCADHDRRLAWTMTCFAQAPDEQPPPGDHRFGCFAFDAPGPDGEVRIHFTNQDDDRTSPLAAAKIARRQGELGAMLATVRRRYPAAVSVRGTSWLYHLEAYRRLFPPAYTASRRRPDRPLHFHGSSSWGQFLDHREQVRAAPRAQFLQQLPDLDPDHPERTFPLMPLLVTAPLAVFEEFYENPEGAAEPPWSRGGSA